MGDGFKVRAGIGEPHMGIRARQQLVHDLWPMIAVIGFPAQIIAILHSQIKVGIHRILAFGGTNFLEILSNQRCIRATHHPAVAKVSMP